MTPTTDDRRLRPRAVRCRRRASRSVLCGLVAMIFLVACGDGGEMPEREIADPPPNGEVEDVSPLSREQLELQAEAMSPAVAESLGIVDTTIHIDRPMPPESLLLRRTELDSLPGF